jgi:hypothetical protein
LVDGPILLLIVVVAEHDKAFLPGLLRKDSHLVAHPRSTVVAQNEIAVALRDGQAAGRLVDQALWAVLAVPCRALLAPCLLRISW